MVAADITTIIIMPKLRLKAVQQLLLRPKVAQQRRLLRQLRNLC